MSTVMIPGRHAMVLKSYNIRTQARTGTSPFCYIPQCDRTQRHAGGCRSQARALPPAVSWWTTWLQAMSRWLQRERWRPPCDIIRACTVKNPLPNYLPPKAEIPAPISSTQVLKHTANTANTAVSVKPGCCVAPPESLSCLL